MSAAVGRGVVLAYNSHTALAASNFDIPAGAVTSLIGPNGSGKSTLLHALAGLVRPRAGRVTVLDGDPDDCHDRVAYVLQAVRVNEALPVTVREVVTMGRYARRGRFGRLDRSDREAVDAAMVRVAVHDLAHRHVRDLSGGQRQRVFVAQGLAQEADVLLLDEPVTGLDIPSHEAIDGVIESERQRGTTVVMTTHDIDEARRGDHVILLAGRVVAEGAPDDVLTTPKLAEAYGGHLVHLEGPVFVDDAHHAPAG